MKKYLLLLFVLSLVCSTEANSQSRLSPEEIADFNRDAVAKINTLTNYISKIGDKKYGDVRDRFVDLAVDLFRSNALIEVSSKNRNSTNSYGVREYLNRMKQLNYKVVIVEYVAEASYFSKFTEVKNADGSIKYIATATIGQRFCGKRNVNNELDKNDCHYEDYTEKNIEIELKRIKDYHGVHWVVLLGDITVTKTK